MEKKLTFTHEQKRLIWETIVRPNYGSPEDAKVFVEVCELHGLNPIIREIIFQKYGERANFLVTRDGYVAHARRDPNFKGLNSDVIREGDKFSLKTKGNEVEIIHEMAGKRGEIVGAWAIAYHDKLLPVAVRVEFEEHFNANAYSRVKARGDRGGSKVWDLHPSAMIQKVAEVYALRRQFPLNGLYAVEEMATDLPQQEKEEKIEVKSNPNPFSEATPTEIQEQKENSSKSQAQLKETQEKQSEVQPSEKTVPPTETPSGEALGESTSTSSQNQENGKFTLLDYKEGERNGKYIRFFAEYKTGAQSWVLARTDAQLAEASKLKGLAVGTSFDMEVISENGFTFVKSVQVFSVPKNSEQLKEKNSSVDSTPPEKAQESQEYFLVDYKTDTSPSGQVYAILTLKDRNEVTHTVYARGKEAIEETMKAPEKDWFSATIEKDENGYLFLVSVNVAAVA